MSNIQLAKKLRDAYSNRKAIPPLRDVIGDNQEVAYAIQNINTQYRIEGGATVVGKKIGLTSLSVQSQFGISSPDFGILFDDMEVLNGLSINMSELMQAKVEGEIAFVLSRDLDKANITIVDIINAIDYVLPAIEIVGSRIDQWNINIADTIADNASASHYVLGHTPRHLHQVDLTNCTMSMTVNGSIVSEGKGSDCLGSPLNAVLWLAQKMQSLETPLQAGELILSGSLGPMVVINGTDQVRAEFSGLGSVSVSFDS